ncbi:MAG UNVERIFIED_CONTAM: type IV secretion system protein [Planctomycetaceae bacterium]|jgi:type IV secretion system protein VirB6
MVRISHLLKTGGYVLDIKHTKCRRENGNIFTDSYPERGAVEYLILPTGVNPNLAEYLDSAQAPTKLIFIEGKTKIVSGDKDGALWFRIKNAPEDYKDSTGAYNIKIAGEQNGGSFVLQVLTPIFTIIRDRIYSVAVGTFSNIICYNVEKSDRTESCINFFNYVRALLILYVTFLGFRFLIGSEIKQEDLFKSILKVVIVAGLINGSTFEFFVSYIFPFVTGFSDQIISNMSGFSMLSAANNISSPDFQNSVSNASYGIESLGPAPFMFLDSIMSKIFLSPSFLFQVLAIIGMGITGPLYFIIICVGVIVFIVAVFRAIAVYIMATLATATLIAVAPMFIVFILFETTQNLFEKWAKFMFRYMMEPVIVMAGIIILTQLFTLYVDQVLAYSVCFKCALPIRIPFSSMLPFPGLQDIPLFCLYWFSPWGLSPTNDPMGMDLAMMVGLIMVAYSAYGYVEFAESIVTRLCGGEGGPSATGMGSGMVSHGIQKGLAKYGLDDKSMAQAKERLKAGRKAKKPDMGSTSDTKDTRGGKDLKGDGDSSSTNGKDSIAPKLQPKSGSIQSGNDNLGGVANSLQMNYQIPLHRRLNLNPIPPVQILALQFLVLLSTSKYSKRIS